MLATLGIIQSSRPSGTLLLDLYPSAAAAYSLRKLRTAYSGSAIRVRRSSDNTEQDIGFDINGNLDETALLSHTGYQNLLERSEEIDNTYWEPRYGTITANNITSPIGTLTAEKFTENTSLNFHGINKFSSLAVSSSNTYTISIYAKYNNRNIVLAPALQNSSLTGTGFAFYTFDLNTGTYVGYGISTTQTTYTHVDAGIISAGNGWYRCYCTFTLSSTQVNFVPYIFAINNASIYTSVPTYTGDGSSGFYIWGIQLNTGSIKSYQQTTTAARDGMGYVTKWYDQSGNGNDGINSTSSQQPRIVNIGTIDKLNSKPACFFDGSNDGLKTSYNIDVSTNKLLTSFIISKASNDTSNLFVLQRNLTADYLSGFASYAYTSSGSGFNDFVLGYGGNSGLASNYTIYRFTEDFKQYQLISLNISTSSISVYKNGVNKSLTNITSGSNMPISNWLSNSSGNHSLWIGSGSYDSNNSLQRSHNGYMQELILFTSDKSSSRSGIESNINSYYSIY